MLAVPVTANCPEFDRFPETVTPDAPFILRMPLLSISPLDTVSVVAPRFAVPALVKSPCETVMLIAPAEMVPVAEFVNVAAEREPLDSDNVPELVAEPLTPTD